VISYDDYWRAKEGDRRLLYPNYLTPEIERNARDLVERVNKLCEIARTEGQVDFETHPDTHSHVSGPWRPPPVNAMTPNAAFRSLHMTGQAVDIFDPDGDLDDWLMTDSGQQALAECILWMEHPAATKGWSHLQSRAPRSGRRVFYP
jgi:hypothetical protein